MSGKRRYKARDYAFGEQLLTLRTRAELRQAELAALLKVSQRTINNWENGEAYPSEVHLRHLLALARQRGLFTPGHEQQEAEALWMLVGQHTAKRLGSFDSAWFASLPPPSRTVPQAKAPAIDTPGHPPRAAIVDWGEAPDTSSFHGRAAELTTLHTWIGAERVRLVALLGMGGIGKTSLAARLVRELAPSFEAIYWRSLRNIPPVEEWLAGAISLLSEHQLVPPESLEARLVLLVELLRKRRSLLILDNFETLLEPAAAALRYRTASAGYGTLLERLGTVDHSSCLLLTSREKPPELATLEGGTARMLRLGGLDEAASRALLEDKHLVGDAAAWEALVTSYGGNALALKLVGETIVELFDAAIASFLAVGVPIFGSITQLLATQLGRLSAAELALLRWLAVAREGVRVGELATVLEPPQSVRVVLEALEGVRSRSLVEPGERRGTFTLQPVVLEYLTEQLVETAAGEILDGQPALLCNHALIQATAPDYVRRTQEQLIGLPLLERLRALSGADGAQQRLLRLLEGWRGQAGRTPGYGPGNVVNLLRLLQGHLRGLDLSRLAMRQAYLAEVDAQDASLVDAHLAETVLAEAFDFPGSVALSTDGALLAAGTSTGEVWLWRVVDRTPLMVVQGHTGAVWGVALSADGRLLASGSGDGTVQLWEAGTGRPVATLRGHTGGVWSVALSADGQLLASGGDDRTLRLWEASTGRLLAALQGHTGRIYGVALSADGRLLASGSEDGTLRLWEASTGQPVATLQGHTGTVWAVALSPDGRLLVSGGEDQTVRLWEASTGRALATLEGHTGAIWSVALSADSQLLASGSGDGTVRLWESSSGRPVATLQGHTGGVWRVALSADSQLLASGSGDGTVRLWEASTGRPLTTLRGHIGTVWSVALSADQLLASGGTDGTVRLWEASSGHLLAALRGHTSGVFGVALSADGQLLVSSGEDGTVRLWETSTGRPVATLQGHSGGVRGVALSADGQLLASGGTDGTARLWEASSGHLLATLQGHTGGVWRVALSADGQLLASSDGDGTVRLWEASSGRLLATLRGHTGTVWAVALSADGQLLASGGGDGMIRLWEVSSGRALATLEGHTGGVWAVALSADGQLLASGGGDGMIRLWETSTGRPVTTMQGHIGGVFGVTLSADSQLLVSGGFDGMIRLWEASTGISLRTLRPERRYERVAITRLAGITDAQRTALIALGAAEHEVR